MPTTLPSPKKKKKPVEKKQPKSSPGQSELFDEDQETPGQKIQSIARAFRLRFKDIGAQRRIQEEQTAEMVSNVDTDADQLRLTKVLYAKHPLVTAKESAKNNITSLWRMETLPYPEPGIRLFPVRSVETEAQTGEVNGFISAMRLKIGEYEESVRQLALKWDDVLKSSKDKLRDLYDPRDYPDADGLVAAVKCTLEPYNLALPEYFKSIDPKEYANAVKQMEDKFEMAANMQSAHIAEVFTLAVDDMVSRISGFHDGTKSRFTDSAVTSVFAAFEEFRTKTRSFGILSGTQLEAVFERTMKIMREGGNNEATLPDMIRKSETKRVDMINQITEIRDSLLSLTKIQPRRRLERD